MLTSEDIAHIPPGRLDRVGIWLSGLCALHCLAMPVLLATLPLWPVALNFHTWTHLALALLLVPVTLLAMWRAYHLGRPARILVLLGIGLGLVLLAVAAREPLGEGGETLVTLLGSGLLIRGHWLNWRTPEAAPFS